MGNKYLPEFEPATWIKKHPHMHYWATCKVIIVVSEAKHVKIFHYGLNRRPNEENFSLKYMGFVLPVFLSSFSTVIVERNDPVHEK